MSQRRKREELESRSSGEEKEEGSGGSDNGSCAGGGDECGDAGSLSGSGEMRGGVDLEAGENEGLCSHTGCKWQSSAATARDRRISARKHKQSLSVHVEHYQEHRHDCPMCLSLIQDRVWTEDEFERVKQRVMRSAEHAAAVAAAAAAAGAGVSMGTTSGTLRERLSAYEDGLAFSAAVPTAVKPLRPGQRSLALKATMCEHNGCVWTPLVRQPNLRADALRNHANSIAVHREHIVACGASCDKCKALVAAGVWDATYFATLAQVPPPLGAENAPHAPSIMVTRLSLPEPVVSSAATAIAAANSANPDLALVYYGELQLPALPNITAAKLKRQTALDTRAIQSDRNLIRAARAADDNDNDALPPPPPFGTTGSVLAATAAAAAAAAGEIDLAAEGLPAQPLSEEVMTRELGLFSAQVQNVLDRDLAAVKAGQKDAAGILYDVATEVYALRAELKHTWMRRYAVEAEPRKVRKDGVGGAKAQGRGSEPNRDADEEDWVEYHRERKRQRLLDEQAPIRTRIAATESTVSRVLTQPARAKFWVGFTQDILRAIGTRLVDCEGAAEAVQTYKEHGELSLSDYLDKYAAPGSS